MNVDDLKGKPDEQAFLRFLFIRKYKNQLTHILNYLNSKTLSDIKEEIANKKCQLSAMERALVVNCDEEFLLTCIDNIKHA